MLLESETSNGDMLDPIHVRGIRNGMALFMFVVLTWALVMPVGLHQSLKFIQPFLLALTLVYLTTPLSKSLSFSLGVLDVPSARKIHACPVPLLGGLSIALGFVYSLYYTFVYTPEMKAVGIACMLVFVVGLVDDIVGVSAIKRLILQLAAVGILLMGGIRMSFLPDTWWGDAGEVILTILWVIGIVNAFNFLDGMDGLASGLAIISAMAFAVAGFLTHQPVLSIMAMPLCGACLAFLRFNFKPASIFLGDSGSTLIGFVLASLGIVGTWGTTGWLGSLMVPALILSVPIYDVIYITIYRVKIGVVRNLREWLEYTGKDHIHHRLSHLGLDDVRTVVFIYSLNFITAICGVVAMTVGLTEQVLLSIAVAVLFVLISILMEVGGWSEKAHKAAGASGLSDSAAE